MTTDALFPSPKEIKKSQRTFSGSFRQQQEDQIQLQPANRNYWPQEQQIRLLKTISLTSFIVYKPPIHSIQIWLSGIATVFCSCRVSNKINLFKDSHCRLFQKRAFQKQRPVEKSMCIYLLKNPFSFFLHFCYVPPYQEQPQQTVFSLE